MFKKRILLCITLLVSALCFSVNALAVDVIADPTKVKAVDVIADPTKVKAANAIEHHVFEITPQTKTTIAYTLNPLEPQLRLYKISDEVKQPSINWVKWEQNITEAINEAVIETNAKFAANSIQLNDMKYEFNNYF